MPVITVTIEGGKTVHHDERNLNLSVVLNQPGAVKTCAEFSTFYATLFRCFLVHVNQGFPGIVKMIEAFPRNE